MAHTDPQQWLAPGTEPVWRAALGVCEPAPAAVDRIRRDNPGVDPQVVSAILTQTALRRRAAPAFGPLADRLLFTPEGLQQSTRPVVAARRAALVAGCGVNSIIDAGCGIGIDALAFQRQGLQVVAVERDPATAAIAGHNLGQPVVLGDATAMDLPHTDAAFWDPARRCDGRRTTDPARWSPSWGWLAAYAAQRPRTVVKAAPGLPHELIPVDAAAEWVSVAGALVETCVWFGGFAAPLPRRRAVLLTPGADPWTPARTLELSSDEPPKPAPIAEVDSFIVEPDPAIIRSHLVDTLAERIGAGLLSSGIAYLTGATPPAEPWAQVFRVLELLPAGGKSLRTALRDRGIGRIEIHTRGLGIDPARLRATLRLSGSGPVHHLLLARAAGKPAGFLVEPLPAALAGG